MIKSKTLYIAVGIFVLGMSPFLIPGTLGAIGQLLEESRVAHERSQQEKVLRKANAKAAADREARSKEQAKAEADDPCSKQNVIARIKRNYANYEDLIKHRNESRKERDGSTMPTAYYALEASKVYEPKLSTVCRGRFPFDHYNIRVFNRGQGIGTIRIEMNGSLAWETYIGKIHSSGPWSQECKDFNKILPEGTVIPDADNPCKREPFIGDYPGYGKPTWLDEFRKNEVARKKREYEEQAQAKRDAEASRRAAADRRRQQRVNSRYSSSNSTPRGGLTWPDLPSLEPKPNETFEEKMARLQRIVNSSTLPPVKPRRSLAMPPGGGGNCNEDTLECMMQKVSDGL